MAHIGMKYTIQITHSKADVADLTVEEAVRIIRHLYGENAAPILDAHWHVVT